MLPCIALRFPMVIMIWASLSHFTVYLDHYDPGLPVRFTLSLDHHDLCLPVSLHCLPWSSWSLPPCIASLFQLIIMISASLYRFIVSIDHYDQCFPVAHYCSPMLRHCSPLSRSVLSYITMISVSPSFVCYPLSCSVLPYIIMTSVSPSFVTVPLYRARCYPISLWSLLTRLSSLFPFNSMISVPLRHVTIPLHYYDICSPTSRYHFYFPPALQYRPIVFHSRLPITVPPALLYRPIFSLAVYRFLFPGINISLYLNN